MAMAGPWPGTSGTSTITVAPASPPAANRMRTLVTEPPRWIHRSDNQPVVMAPMAITT